MQNKYVVAWLTIIVVVTGLAVWLGIGASNYKENEAESKEYHFELYPAGVDRFDCYPEPDGTEEACMSRGCAWSEPEIPEAPWCFYPSGHGYRMVGDPEYLLSGITVMLERMDTPVRYADAVFNVRLDIEYRGDKGIHFKFTDPDNPRYEVPLEIEDVHSFSDLYDVIFYPDPFGFQITRRSTGDILFDTTVGTLTFEDQFLQLSTRLPSTTVYGFGEHNHRRFKHDLDWKTWAIFAHDIMPIGEWNLYGAHPFHMCIENNGSAHGLFFLNSNAMEIVLQPTPALTYRTTGGILDFYLFLGPTPGEVIQQYLEVIGKPVMVPYWMLGFQLSRWDYGSLDRVKEVWSEMVEAGIPYDVQYGDIDYMDEAKDFTYNPVEYSGLPEFVDMVHDHGQKYIIILDPCIKQEEGYHAYDRGMEDGVFIQKGDGSGPLVGRVWPGDCHYPDFSRDSTHAWWTQQCVEFHDVISYDGLWIDMNEPSNFVSGSTSGCPENKYNNPPYVPDIQSFTKTLYSRTKCMDSPQDMGIHYDVHSMYGDSMSRATHSTLQTLFPEKRSMVISRSTFPGTGRYAHHWLGDNESRWRDLVWSIVGSFEFNMFGIPFVGPDICGFLFNTQYELCWRWTQLGAFYTFSRNHNAQGFTPQHPTAFDEAFANMTRDVLLERYRLLPYLYSLFDDASRHGTTVFRPLVFEFPADEATYDLDRQFLWGSAFMITPVMEEGQDSVEAYFPDARWFDYYTGKDMASVRGRLTYLMAPLDVINLHVRGGYIFPLQEPSNTTHYSRQNPMGLLVALDDDHSAEGFLYWDDGETRDENNHMRQLFYATGGDITNSFAQAVYDDPNNLQFEYITIYGADDYDDDHGVYVDEVQHEGGVFYDASLKVLKITGLTLDISSTWKVKWKAE